MKNLPKLVSIILLLLLAAPLALLKGCGSDNTTLNGDASGACPNRVAPDQSTIEPTAGTLGAALSTGACYPHVVFTIKDSDGKPMNNICVEIYTDGASAIAKQPVNDSSCNAAVAVPLTTLVTETDKNGNIALELITPACTTGDTFFVHASSGAISGEYTATCQ